MLLAALALGWTLVSPAADGRSDARFIADLQAASVQNNRTAIALMVHYPIKVIASGWIIPVNDRATFIRYFDAFFTDDIRDLIAAAASKPRSGAPADVVSIGNGVIRAMAFNGRFQIIGISVPPASGKIRGARRGTTTVSFPAGHSQMAYTGTLAKGEHEAYIVHAARNELIEVHVDGVRGRDIVAHLLDAATRTPIDARAKDGTRAWTGRVPAAGDYLVDIVRVAPDGDAVLTYTLSVSVR